jgi:very-short-patch-repair endonuclease
MFLEGARQAAGVAGEGTMKGFNECETLLAKHLKELKLEFISQHEAIEGRKWRWDFLLLEHGILIEIDGYFGGHHGAGWGSDNEKQNAAVMRGWRPLRFSTNDVKRGKAKEFLKQWLGESDSRLRATEFFRRWSKESE